MLLARSAGEKPEARVSRLEARRFRRTPPLSCPCMGTSVQQRTQSRRTSARRTVSPSDSSPRRARRVNRGNRSESGIQNSLPLSRTVTRNIDVASSRVSTFSAPPDPALYEAGRLTFQFAAGKCHPDSSRSCHKSREALRNAKPPSAQSIVQPIPTLLRPSNPIHPGEAGTAASP